MEKDDPVQSVENIKNICGALLRRGKIVFLCSIPLPLEAWTSSYGTHRARNELIRAYVSSYGTTVFPYIQTHTHHASSSSWLMLTEELIVSRTEHPNLHLGAELDALEMQKPAFRKGDGIHFSSMV